MNAKITALIPTYKRPKLLQRAILSVLGQSYTNLKLCIFDNASGKETKDIVTSLSKNDDRVKYHCHQNNIGALANFSFALKSVNTPYFSILSDDDFLAKDFYKDAIHVLENNPNVMFVILNTLRVDENTNLIVDKPSTYKLKIYSGKSGFDEFHSGNIPQTWTGMVFRKELAKLYYEAANKNDIGSDMRFLFHATSLHNFAYLSKVGAFFTVHSDSASATIKSVDLIHLGVQISRYVEIFYDKNVSQDVKDRTIFYIKKLLSIKPNVILSIKNIVQNFLDPKKFRDKKIEENINDYKYAGYSIISSMLNFFYNSKIIKFFFQLLLSRLYKKKLDMNRSKMLKLQNGIYKNHFDYIRESESLFYSNQMKANRISNRKRII